MCSNTCFGLLIIMIEEHHTGNIIRCVRVVCYLTGSRQNNSHSVLLTKSFRIGRDPTIVLGNPMLFNSIILNCFNRLNNLVYCTKWPFSTIRWFVSSKKHLNLITRSLNLCEDENLIICVSEESVFRCPFRFSWDDPKKWMINWKKLYFH